MPWVVNNVMSQRHEFISLATSEQSNIADLCRRFKISRTTGYKWLRRYKHQPTVDSLSDYSKRPKSSPYEISADIQHIFITLRQQYPYWGARKLMILAKEAHPGMSLPCERTVSRILQRAGLLQPDSPKGIAYQRFEYARPNDLWQMDYKGEFKLTTGSYCYPLTVSDDHSRFNIVLDAHSGTRNAPVKQSLTNVFRLYGLPERMLMDRGLTWYSVGDDKHHWTKLTVWLMRLGIRVIHARAYHPQTLGKEERFHRTLKRELLSRNTFESLSSTQTAFNRYRHEYNCVRPHEAIGLRRPHELYRPSSRVFPRKLAPIDYPKDVLVKRVGFKGWMWYKGNEWRIHKGLEGEYVQLKVRGDDQVEVRYINTLVRILNLRTKTSHRV